MLLMLWVCHNKADIPSQLCLADWDMNSASLLRMAVSSGCSNAALSQESGAVKVTAVDVGGKKTNSWSSPGLQPSTLLFKGVIAFVSGLEPKPCGTGKNGQSKLGNNWGDWKAC